MDDEELLFNYRVNEMERLFPTLKFCSDEKHLDLLDCVLVKSKDAIIYYKHDAYYYSHYPYIPIELIYIKRNRLITYRDFYNECCEKWEHDCGDHRFLESIQVLNDTQIDLWFGS